MKKLLVLLFINISLFASDIVYTGTLSVIVFKNGKALKNVEIIVDASKKIKTDSDGWAESKLKVGKHQLQIIAKDRVGNNLGYIKKPFIVKRDKDTQIIASLKSQNSEVAINIDEPKGTLNENNRTKSKKSTGFGKLEGYVKISNSNKPISGARIFVKGTDIDAKTDKNGYFSLKVPSGVSLGLSVVHSAYSSQTINDIKLEKDEVVTKNIELTPASMELEEYVVLAPKVEGSIASVMAEEKETSSIANILGSEQISKKGDSSAAGALKRVTGVTLVGGKNIYVRGLGERYSNINLNSLPLPSPDPTTRVVPLDIFPAGVIGALKVQKSASADIPSDFGGGYINIRTKDKSQGDDFVKLSLSLSANSDTGKDFDTYQGGASDWTGFDDGYREIPSSLLNAMEVNVGDRTKSSTTDYFTKEELSKFTQEYAQRDYNIKKEKMPLGYGISLSASKNYKYDKNHQFTIFGNYGYNQKSSYVKEEFYGYDYSKELNALYEEPSKSGTNSKSSTNYNHGGMLNIGYSYKDFLKLKYTKLYTLNTKNKTRIVSGIMGSNYDYLTKSYLEWEERSLNVDQFTGEYDYEKFNHYHTLEFGLEYAKAMLNQPNNFEYTYITDEDNTTRIDTAQANFLANNLTSEDELFAMFLKNKTYLDWFSEDDYVDVGFNISTKERISRQRKFYLRPIGGKTPEDDELTGDVNSIMDDFVRPNIDYDDRGFIVSPLFLPADYFDATINELSLYSGSLLKPYEYLDLMFGLRYVSFSQTVYQYQEDRENPDMSQRRLIQKVPQDLEVSDIFPSASVKYRVNEDNHIDFAISKTYIVPDLREFTSGLYFHPYDVATVMGNPELESTNIYNLDLKYSHYISDSENIKFGLFFKYLDKPIEDVMLPSTSLPLYSYDNAKSATLYGLEIDGRKKLDILAEVLSDYYISGNVSFTDSEVTLTDEQKETFTNESRQLQGLSQLVINTTVGYDTKKRSIALSYNKMGERIRKVGLIDADDRYPDHIEVPPTLLDLTWIENIGKRVKVKFKAKNILNDETIWKQGERISKRFKTGSQFSIGASYKF